MSKKKFLIAVLVIVLLSALLAGCDFLLGGWVEDCCGGFMPLPIALVCFKLFA